MASRNRNVSGAARGRHNHQKLQRLNEKFRAVGMDTQSSLTRAKLYRKALAQKAEKSL